MNALELYMKRKDLIQFCGFSLISFNEIRHRFIDLLRWNTQPIRLNAELTHASLMVLIGISAVGQEVMHLLDKGYREWCCDIVHHIAHTDEMVHHLHDIIHLGWMISWR